MMVMLLTTMTTTTRAAATTKKDDGNADRESYDNGNAEVHEHGVWQPVHEDYSSLSGLLRSSVLVSFPVTIAVLAFLRAWRGMLRVSCFRL